MSNIGRPTEDRKENRLQFRLSDGDIEKLDYCCKVLSLTKAEIIRQGIEEIYQKVRKHK